MMRSFNNDYSEGCHPMILEALQKDNLMQNNPYGLDRHSENASRIIKEHIKCSEADIHYLTGGTQTNLTVISSFLKPHEAVIAADSAHINVHETGAIEYTGHKVLSVRSEDGKVNPEMIESILQEHKDEHMVKPRLVYISNATELGTIYQKEELKALRACCLTHDLLLYADGARLGHALCSKRNDLTMADMAAYTDAFYIGGTKNGALLGEALVITNRKLQEDFRYLIKQKGAMLAKGWIVGIQFEMLFEGGLYYEMACHADEMAEKIIDTLRTAGYKLVSDSSTNQIFVELPDSLIEKLKEEYVFSVDKRTAEGFSSVRFVTSWATKEEDVERLINDLR
ncbi:L-threonine aldolase [Parasporobacterium paucivorans DSM 15970]|uniref:L-threonine aldolase n=2 Tax=Parasporobacterium TaxID=115543 RepID=A0A1M6A9Y1_9FIRM|nr:L-threonine aldolase [Parasporobacterium paucivorans DSM 15970]